MLFTHIVAACCHITAVLSPRSFWPRDYHVGSCSWIQTTGWFIAKQYLPNRQGWLESFAEGILPFHWLDAHDGRYIACYIAISPFHLFFSESSAWSVFIPEDYRWWMYCTWKSLLRYGRFVLNKQRVQMNTHDSCAKEVSLIVELRPCPSNQAMDNEHSICLHFSRRFAPTS